MRCADRSLLTLVPAVLLFLAVPAMYIACGYGSYSDKYLGAYSYTMASGNACPDGMEVATADENGDRWDQSEETELLCEYESDENFRVVECGSPEFGT